MYAKCSAARVTQGYLLCDVLFISIKKIIYLWKEK